MNEGRLRFGFDSSAPPGQTVQKSLGTGIYLKEGTVSNETIRNSCSSWNQLPPNPQSQLFALLAPEDLDAALLPQKHLCFCLTRAQPAPCNLIMHCCTKVISVWSSGKWNNLVDYRARDLWSGVLVTLVSLKIDSVMSPCRAVLLRHLIQQKSGCYEITPWMLGMILSEQAEPVLGQHFYPLWLYWFWSRADTFTVKFTALSSHKLQNLSLIEV